jgi:C4-type Zn-finger protein
MLAHTENRECPVCQGFCRLAKVNSLTPYEEIDAEMHRKKTYQLDESEEMPPLFSRKMLRR